MARIESDTCYLVRATAEVGATAGGSALGIANVASGSDLPGTKSGPLLGTGRFALVLLELLVGIWRFPRRHPQKVYETRQAEGCRT